MDQSLEQDPGLFRLLPGIAIVQQKAFHNLFPHRHDGVQGRHWVLEDHGDFLTPDFQHFLLRFF